MGVGGGRGVAAAGYLASGHGRCDRPGKSKPRAAGWGDGDVYANAASAEVYAEITGVWADDRTRADGRYLILDAVGNEFIVTDGQGVYQTGKQLLIEKLTTATGAAMTRTTQTLTLNDEDVVSWLQALRMANPSARVYLSGSLTVDFPEDVRSTVLPRQLAAVTVVGESVELQYCELEVAIGLLSDQWATGSLAALILSEP